MGNVATFIKMYREEKGLTQKQLSKHLGYKNGQFVSNWERGLSLPPPKAIKTICKVLGSSPDSLIEQMVGDYKSFLQKEVRK